MSVVGTSWLEVGATEMISTCNHTYVPDSLTWTVATMSYHAGMK